MPVFRNIPPKRRLMKKIVSSYKLHRKALAEDFNFRCGYCDCAEEFRRTDYHIDHFIPKSFLEKIFLDKEKYKIEEQKYSNLVYSCHFCNKAKWNKWPTKRIDHSYKNDEGFIDPCEAEYEYQFTRNENSEIIPKTKLGEWMYLELKLGNPEHSIIWHIEEIYNEIKEIKKTCGYMKSNKSAKLTKLTLELSDYFEKLIENKS